MTTTLSERTVALAAEQAHIDHVRATIDKTMAEMRDILGQALVGTDAHKAITTGEFFDLGPWQDADRPTEGADMWIRLAEEIGVPTTTIDVMRAARRILSDIAQWRDAPDEPFGYDIARDMATLRMALRVILLRDHGRLAPDGSMVLPIDADRRQV